MAYTAVFELRLKCAVWCILQTSGARGELKLLDTSGRGMRKMSLGISRAINLFVYSTNSRGSGGDLLTTRPLLTLVLVSASADDKGLYMTVAAGSSAAAGPYTINKSACWRGREVTLVFRAVGVALRCMYWQESRRSNYISLGWRQATPFCGTTKTTLWVSLLTRNLRKPFRVKQN